MIDLDALVTKPFQDIFGLSITVTPTKSQPAAAPYLARGVYNDRHIDVQLEDGGILSSREISLDIRVAEFDVAPKQGDQVLIVSGTPAAIVGKSFLVDDIRPDSIGGAELILKALAP